MKGINAANAEFRQSILYSWQAYMGTSSSCDTHSSKKEKHWPCLLSAPFSYFLVFTKIMIIWKDYGTGKCQFFMSFFSQMQRIPVLAKPKLYFFQLIIWDMPLSLWKSIELDQTIPFKSWRGLLSHFFTTEGRGEPASGEHNNFHSSNQWILSRSKRALCEYEGWELTRASSFSAR